MYAEEYEQYNFAVLQNVAMYSPKQIKKIKPSELRFAGSARNPTNSIAAFVASKTGGNFKPNGSVEEFAKATDRVVVYSAEDRYILRDVDTGKFTDLNVASNGWFINSETGEIIDRRITIIIPLKNTEYNA